MSALDTAYYTVNQIAELLMVHRETVRRWILDEQLGAIMIGREYRISKSDFETFLDNRKLL
jgi:excisionase family DNA binding protein